jgi:hypothetical protein
MKDTHRRTVLLPLPWLILMMIPVFLLSTVLFIGMVVVYPDVHPSATLVVEIGAALAAITAVFTLWWFVMVTRRSFRLERELALIRAGAHDESRGMDRRLSRLGAIIRDYGADLSRLSAVKTGRIKAQQTLIQMLIRSMTGKNVLILSGSGTVLYSSAGWTKDAEESTVPDEPELDPPPAAMASHLLAGNGSGTVTVNGRKMSFTGVFGRTVATPGANSQGGDDFNTTLAYIVLSDEALSAPQLKVLRTDPDDVGTNRFGDRLRSLLKRR